MAVNRKKQVTNQLVADTLILNGKDHTCHDVHIETTYFGLRRESGTANGRISFPRTRIQKVREILRTKKVNTSTTYTLNEMKELVRMKVWETYEKACELGMITDVGLKVLKSKNTVDIVFNMVGTTAGQCCYDGYEIYDIKLRYHPILMAENFDKYLNRTVPHEVAHHIDFIMGNGHGSHHGRRWKSVMTRLGYENTRCHSYDTTNASRGGGQRRWEYKCSCKTYNLSTVRHNRSRRYFGMGSYYKCKKCGGSLVFTGKQV